MKQDILVASPYHHTTHTKKQKEQVEKDFVLTPIVYIKWQKLHTHKIRQVNKMTKTLGVWAQIVLY